MHRLQFSLRSLLGFVAVAAISCEALVRPSFLWASAIWTVAMGLLAVAVIGAVCCREVRQAFCLGAVVPKSPSTVGRPQRGQFHDPFFGGFCPAHWPVRRPSQSTNIRSHNVNNSGSSLEVTIIPKPARQSLSINTYSSALAPTSIPGWGRPAGAPWGRLGASGR